MGPGTAAGITLASAKTGLLFRRPKVSQRLASTLQMLQAFSRRPPEGGKAFLL